MTVAKKVSKPYNNLVGNRYHRLIVLSLTKERSPEGQYLWNCQCNCGTEVKVTSSRLKTGNTKSCGCLAREILSARNTTHNMSKFPEYSNWKDMFKRCYNKNNKRFENYSEKGITVNEDFKDFSVFLTHIGRKPEDGQVWSIGRIDNNSSYTYGNVRWETLTEQARNHSIQKNNKSGHQGISVRYRQSATGKYKVFVAAFSYLGKKISKEFSTLNTPEVEVLQKAIAFREDGMNKLRACGIVYADSHGVSYE